MNLTTEVFGDVIVVHAPDELGDETGAQLGRFLAGLQQRKVVVDLDGAESLDSAGLSALLDAQDELRLTQGDLKIIANNHVNRKVLEITRLDQHLEVFGGVIDAVKSFV